jgi:peptide deformylase
MNILVYPDPILRRKTEPVHDLHQIAEEIEEMFRTMYEAKGVGLAANQVGLPDRFFVMNAAGKPGKELVLVNPEIVETRDEVIESEGCLSLPGLEGRVHRYNWVKVRAQTLDGREVELEGDGLFARAVQHEMDHLNGVLFIDHVSPATRIALKPRLTEMEKKFKKK